MDRKHRPASGRMECAGAAVLVVVALLACNQGTGTEKPAASNEPQQREPQQREVPSAASVAAGKASATPKPEPPRPPATTVTCKSTAAGKPAVLGTRTDWIRGVKAWGDRVYVLSHNQQLARTTLSYYTRDGATNGEVGRYEGLGHPNPSAYRVTKDYAYFTQRNNLMRFPLSGGSATTVAEGFATMATVSDGKAYGVRCAATGKQDQVVRVSESGGSVEVLATIERSTGKCQYGDIEADGLMLFVTDWEGRRLLAIETGQGVVQELAKGPAFAADIFLQSDHVDFTASGGLHRVPRAGGAPKIVASVGDSPFGTVVFDGHDYWIFQAQPYETSEGIWRLAAGGAEPEKVFTFFVKDVTAGSGVEGLAVDDECLYYSQRGGDGSYRTLYALRKPPTGK